MAIDWKKEFALTRRIYWWYMKVGFIATPFGILYGCVNLYLGHESMAALVVVLATALVTIYKILGPPPNE